MTSIVLTSVVVGGVIVQEGALEGEQARACGGCQDENPMSGLRGGDLAPRYYCLDVLIPKMQL
jgi:hypothetical protein